MTEHLIINGERVAASDGGTFDVFDPSSGDVLATVAKATKTDVDRAVEAAQAAFEGKAWGGLAPAERGRIMQRIAQALRDRAEELATLESRDNGKPLARRGPTCRWPRATSSSLPASPTRSWATRFRSGPGFLDFTIREPIGVSAQIAPWNYPIQIGARGVAPALAAGCTVVLKPSSEAPMTALRLGEIALACGLPPGVLNVVPGTGAEAGTALASHPDINQLTFTGSVDVGIAGGDDGGRERRAGRHGARRQVAEHRLCRRRSRSGGAGRCDRDLPERRPDVLGWIAAARRAEGARRARRSAGGARQEHARRPRRERPRHGADHLEEAARDDRAVRAGRHVRRARA